MADAAGLLIPVMQRHVNRMSVAEKDDDSVGADGDICSCGQRTVRACRSGCFGTLDCDCGGACTGSEG